MIEGVEDLDLHHLYRAMTFLGEEVEDQEDRTPFSPRCTKDLIEEGIFFERRDLFTGLDIVFFDTTSIYFEGSGGETIGQKGHSKDHRPDLNQMVVGTVIDDGGKPVWCEMWPGNTTDVKTLIPVIDRIRNRFSIGQFCIVADQWADIKQDLKALQETVIEDHGKSLAVRTECVGTSGKTFSACWCCHPCHHSGIIKYVKEECNL